MPTISDQRPSVCHKKAHFQSKSTVGKQSITIFHMLIPYPFISLFHYLFTLIFYFLLPSISIQSHSVLSNFE